MSALVTVFVSGLALVLVLGYRRFARRERAAAVVRAGRDAGASAFAESLGRPASDRIVHATFQALVRAGGRTLEAVRADDDLARLYGIVDDDLDDVVREIVCTLPGGSDALLKGHHESLRTPRHIVNFVSALMPNGGE